MNHHGVFSTPPGEHQRGLEGRSWGDSDGDGWPDLNLVSLGRSIILHNDHGKFHKVHDTVLLRGRAACGWTPTTTD